MSFEPRDYLRHILVEADYLVQRSAGLSYEGGRDRHLRPSQRRRHSTIGQISPAAYERRARAEGVDAVENGKGRRFPPRPHRSVFSGKEERRPVQTA